MKKLGLVAVAALALTALAAAPASASPRELAADIYPATLTGTGEQLLTVKAGSVNCQSTLGAELTESSPVASATLSGTCSSFGSTYPIKANGCKVELNPDWSSYSIGPKGCGPITVQVSTCKVSIPAQRGLKATYEAVVEEGVKKVLVTSQATHIKYSCGGVGTYENGSLTGTWLLTPSKGNGVYLEAPAYDSLFAAEAYPATLLGSQVGEISTEGGKIECAGVSLSGSLTATSNSLTLTPAYTGCEAFGFLEATVKTNGCSFVYWVGEGEKYPQDISCPPGASITVQGGTCSISIPAQAGLNSTSYSLTESKTTGRDSISIASNVTGLAYTVTKDGFLCPFGGTGSRTDGKYTDNALVEGRDAEAQPMNIRIGA